MSAPEPVFLTGGDYNTDATYSENSGNRTKTAEITNQRIKYDCFRLQEQNNSCNLETSSILSFLISRLIWLLEKHIF